jgi:hypothetical protein
MATQEASNLGWQCVSAVVLTESFLSHFLSVGLILLGTRFGVKPNGAMLGSAGYNLNTGQDDPEAKAFSSTATPVVLPCFHPAGGKVTIHLSIPTGQLVVSVAFSSFV